MKDYTKILFLDTETVPIVESFDQLDERFQKLFKKKFQKQIDEAFRNEPMGPNCPDESYVMDSVWKSNASFHAEFAKIVCVSIGAFYRQGADHLNASQKFTVKAIASTSEYGILDHLNDIINNQRPDKVCTHNGKNFDIPFLCRKMIMLGIPIPYILNTMGKKPWEIAHDDTMEMWGFGEWGKKVSLDLLAASLGIPTPKDVMDGSQVAHYYYQVENGIKLIGEYCNKDVITLAKCYLRLNGETEEVTI